MISHLNLRGPIGRIVPPSQWDACPLNIPILFSCLHPLEDRLAVPLDFKVAPTKEVGRAQRESPQPEKCRKKAPTGITDAVPSLNDYII